MTTAAATRKPAGKSRATSRLYDKVSQLIALSRDGGTARVRNETIDNALLDLADYALREYVERRVDEADYDF